MYCDLISVEAFNPLTMAASNQLLNDLPVAGKYRKTSRQEWGRPTSVPAWSVIRDSVHMLTIRIDGKQPVHPRDFAVQICALSGCSMEDVADWMSEGSEPGIRYQEIIWRWVQNHEKRERMVNN